MARGMPNDAKPARGWRRWRDALCAWQENARAHHWRFGDMPPVPGVTPDDVAHITAYVRMHQRRAGIR